MAKKIIKRWTEGECQKLSHLYHQGNVIKDIAETMGRSYSNIVWKISQLGLKRGKTDRDKLSATGGRVIQVSEGHIIHRSR